MQHLSLLSSGPHGAYAKTTFYRNEGGKKFVSKVPHEDDSEANEVTHDQVREVALLKMLNKHPNVVKFHGFHKNQILTEYAGRTLANYTSRGNYKSLVIQLIKGVAFLHASGVAHRDLSSKNVVVKRGKLTIIDFGMSRYTTSHCSEQNTYTSRVTCLWHRAPELLSVKRRRKTLQYDAQMIDNWSVGILITEILGCIPWLRCSKSREQEQVARCIDAERVIEYLSRFHQKRWFLEADFLLRGFLDSDPQTRLTCSKALEQMTLEKQKGHKPPTLYPLSEKSAAFLGLRKKHLQRLLPIIARYCHSPRTFSMTCAIVDAYQEKKYDSDWSAVTLAALSLCTKLAETDVLDSAMLANDKDTVDKISEKQYAMLEKLECRLIYQVVDDFLPHEDEQQKSMNEVKEDLLLKNVAVSAEDLAKKVLQTLFYQN
jgi:serine/threonine protein kinase